MYGDSATGDVPGVLAIFHPEIEWHECMGMPFVKDSGQYKGPDALVGNVFKQLGSGWTGSMWR
jgi:hypothetical protein